MTKHSKSSSFHKILMLVFGVAFGLVLLVLGYQAVKTSSDLRSRAAQTNQIYKQWEFNGSDTEGWNAIFPYTAGANYGIFLLSEAKPNAMPMFQNTKVGVPLPKGLKSISLSMAVGKLNIFPKGVNINSVKESSGVSVAPAFQGSIGKNSVCSLDVRTCSDGSVVGRSGSGCSFVPCPVQGKRKFVAYIVYKLENRTAFERPIQFSGLADGSFRTYTVNLPNAEDVSIDSMLVVLASGVKKGEMVGVDWIRLLGPVTSSPTPTGGPVCYYQQVKCIKAPCPKIRVCVTPTPTPCAAKNVVYVVSSSCKPGSSVGATYTCPDGYQGSMRYSKCKDNSAILQEAASICTTNNHCGSITPTILCNTGLKDYVPIKPEFCASGSSLGITYVCWDGSTGNINEGTVCYSIADMKLQATFRCAGKSNCTSEASIAPKPGTPAPASSPTPTPTPMTPTFYPAQ